MDIGYSFGQMIWIVLVYSFLGWCCEVAFAAVRRGIFVNFIPISIIHYSEAFGKCFL